MKIVQWCGLCCRHAADYQLDFEEPIGTIYACAECNQKLKEASS